MIHHRNLNELYIAECSHVFMLLFVLENVFPNFVMDKFHLKLIGADSQKGNGSRTQTV